MRYLGGKSRLAKPIVNAILNHVPNRGLYIEPFIGGGSILCEAAPHFHTVWAADSHEDLILLWQALQDGWEPPSELTQEEYDDLRYSKTPSALRGFAGFPCSFGGKWFGGLAKGGFSGGKARNHVDEGKRNCLAQARLISNVQFVRSDYKELEPLPGSVVYCDPPYADTTSYSSTFDNVEFWEVMNAWVEIGAYVFVSEIKAPDDWEPIWHLERRMGTTVNKTGISKESVKDCLYVHKSQNGQ